MMIADATSVPITLHMIRTSAITAMLVLATGDVAIPHATTTIAKANAHCKAIAIMTITIFGSRDATVGMTPWSPVKRGAIARGTMRARVPQGTNESSIHTMKGNHVVSADTIPWICGSHGVIVEPPRPILAYRNATRISTPSSRNATTYQRISQAHETAEDLPGKAPARPSTTGSLMSVRKGRAGS